MLRVTANAAHYVKVSHNLRSGSFNVAGVIIADLFFYKLLKDCHFNVYSTMHMLMYTF